MIYHIRAMVDFTRDFLHNTLMTDEQDDVVLEVEHDGAEETALAKLKKLRAELKKAKLEAAENLAGWQRSKADYVNLSRRVREQESVQNRNGLLGFARSVIGVFDSLEAAEKGAEEAGHAVQNGIRQVTKQLESALKEHGVVRFTPKTGDVFDPNTMEPVRTVASASEKEDNTIADVLQSGYVAHGALIRPARVSVRKFE